VSRRTRQEYVIPKSTGLLDEYDAENQRFVIRTVPMVPETKSVVKEKKFGYELVQEVEINCACNHCHQDITIAYEVASCSHTLSAGRAMVAYDE